MTTGNKELPGVGHASSEQFSYQTQKGEGKKKLLNNQVDN